MDLFLIIIEVCVSIILLCLTIGIVTITINLLKGFFEDINDK